MTDQIPLSFLLIISSVLFLIGCYGFQQRRNAVRLLMSIEIMLNAANINLIAFTTYGDVEMFSGVIFTLISISIAAAEAAIGLAILLALYRNYKEVDIASMNMFNG